MSEKYLINCTHGAEDAEKATIAFILAFTSSKTNQTAVFVSSGGTDLITRTRPDLQVPSYEALNGLVDGYVANGGSIWLCPACAKAKGIAEEDLIPGVEIAGAPRTMAYLASEAKTLA